MRDITKRKHTDTWLNVYMSKLTHQSTTTYIIGGIAICCVGWFVGVFSLMCQGTISTKQLKIEARFQWTTNRKWHMAN